MAPVGLVRTRDLFVERLLGRRQQAEQAELAAFFLRERGPLVQQRAIQQKLPEEWHVDRVGADRPREHRFDVHSAHSIRWDWGSHLDLTNHLARRLTAYPYGIGHDGSAPARPEL